MTIIKSKKIRNAPETSNLKPIPEGGWLEWWKESKDMTNSDVKCFCCKTEIANRGGHVWNGRNLPLYIIPLCASCNSDTNESAFTVLEEDLLEEDYSDKDLWELEHCD